MATSDGLSGLSDDLLVCVVSFLPARDAARTAVLSHRWRSLWLSTDALNLDSRSYSYPYGARRPYLYSRSYCGLEACPLKDRLLSDACAALRATDRRPVRKLSLFIHGGTGGYCARVMSTPTSYTRISPWREPHDLFATLLAMPELRHIEEVRLGFGFDKRERRHVCYLDPAVLPGQSLRVMDLSSCYINGADLLPRLSKLRLYKCSSNSMEDLDDFISVMPSLTSLHIESHFFYSGVRFRLHSASLTTLAIAGLRLSSRQRIQLNTPCLRTFVYEGSLNDFTMESPATELTLVELTLAPRSYEPEHPWPWFTSFWQFLGNLRHAKILKLNVPSIEDMAVEKDVQHEHLVPFLGLERLELEGPFDPARRNEAATAIANLLQCCPAIHDLQIRIVNQNSNVIVTEDVSLPPFDVSLDLFKRRYIKDITVMIDFENSSSDVAELLELTGQLLAELSEKCEVAVCVQGDE